MKIRLRNKITGRYYAAGKCFTSEKGDVIEKDSPAHALIKATFDMTHVEEAPVDGFVVYRSLGYNHQGPTYYLKQYSNGIAEWTEDKHEARIYPTSRGAKCKATNLAPARYMRIGSTRWNSGV